MRKTMVVCSNPPAYHHLCPGVEARSTLIAIGFRRPILLHYMFVNKKVGVQGLSDLILAYIH